MKGRCKACGGEGHDRRSCPVLISERRVARAREIEAHHDAQDRDRRAEESIADVLDGVPRDRWKVVLVGGMARAQRRIVHEIEAGMTRDRIAARAGLDIEAGGMLTVPKAKA